MRTFTEQEVRDTYIQHVAKGSSYFQRANEGYNQFTDDEKEYWKGKDFPRVAAIIDFKEWVEKYKLKRIETLLATCRTDPELDYIEADSTVICEYRYGDNDLHTMNVQQDFEMIIFNQTLEHLYNPFMAMENLFNHLRPGGFLYTTVPTINIPHMVPFHFWGITPIGLCMLSKSVGFEVLECGYWGNYKYIEYIFKHNTWPDKSQIENERNYIHNDSNLVNQAQTWVLLQK